MSYSGGGNLARACRAVQPEDLFGIGDNARSVTIAGAGHRIDEEAPDELARLVHELMPTAERI